MKTEDKRQKLILEAFANRDSDGAAEMTGLALQRWTQLAAKLSPLVGEAGFCALYARSLRLTNPQFDWLSVVEAGTSTDLLFRILRENLHTAGPDRAGKGNLVLMETFTGLLSKLIGDSLTERILIAAWSIESDGMNTKEVRK